MESLTKRRLDRDQIAAAVGRGFGADTRPGAVEELPDGMFNAVYRLQLEPSGETVVLKSSPPADVPLMTYEHHIMRTEAAFYEQAGQAVDVPVPRVLVRDFSRRHLDGDLLFISHLDGAGWHRCHERLDSNDRARLRRDLGAMVGRLHELTGTEFGYSQAEAAHGPRWRTTFLAMLDDVFADAERFGVRLPVAAGEIRATVEKNTTLLDAVTTPRLVHFDLWEGNIFLADIDGRLEISGLIDGERALWADPLAEFVATALFADIADDHDFLAGYGEATMGTPCVITPEMHARIAMYKIYLDLIIMVEGAPRGYADEHADVTRRACDDLHRALARLR